MSPDINILKGLHPGLFLARELKARNISKSAFALGVNEYPQTLSAILTGKRGMNTPLAIRIEEALGLEEGTLMILQVYYDIRQVKEKRSANFHPNIEKYRPALFWDTSIEKIDWYRQKKAIVTRVFERGNYAEKKETLRFYGRKTIDSILDKHKTK